MLDINVTIKGDKIIFEGLDRFAQQIPGAVQKGLTDAVRGMHSEALALLNAAGAKGDYSTGKWKEKDTPDASGGYPVPVRTGFLKRALHYLEPGQSKSFGNQTDFQTRKSKKVVKDTMKVGDTEAMLYNTAEYAYVIHEGRGSSAKFGPRPFLTDALEKFNQGDKIKKIMEDEINKAIKGAGLK